MEEPKLIYLLIGACIALLSREFGRHMQMNISYNLKQHEKYSRISPEMINSLANHLFAYHVKRRSVLDKQYKTMPTRYIGLIFQTL